MALARREFARPPTLAQLTARAAAAPAFARLAAAFVEQLFGRPGIGRVALDAISNRDVPVVMALVVLAGIVFVVVNLVVEVLYPILDPRLRIGR